MQQFLCHFHVLIDSFAKKENKRPENTPNHFYYVSRFGVYGYVYGYNIEHIKQKI